MPPTAARCKVQVLAREAELRSLRAQLDPHFLFNCLHSISALTTADPPAARRMCLLLAEFLRETLALGAERRITIARELKLVDRFLSVERIRFGDRLDVDLSADADAAALPRAAAAAAAARRERGHARDRSPARSRHDSDCRLAHARPPHHRRRESVRSRPAEEHRRGRGGFERARAPAARSMAPRRS